MEAKTPQQFFYEILPLRFQPEKANGVDVTVQVNITGAMGGDWMVEIKDKKLKVNKGTYPSPKLKVEVSDTDFLDIVNERLGAQKAFFLGKIRFKGDLTLALKLRDAGFL